MKLSLSLIALLALGIAIGTPVVTSATPKEVTPIASTVTKADYVIQAGRVGKISQTTTKKDLIRLFGAANVEDFTDTAPEGTGNNPATHVKIAGKMSIDVLWKDSKRQQAVAVNIYDSRWHTAEGIAVGTKVSQLHKQFGTLKFSGFGWDYGGLIHSGNKKFDQYRKSQGLSLRLGVPEGGCRPIAKCDKVMGDGVELTSADKVLTEVNAQVITLYVSLR